MIPKIIHYCWFGGKEMPELAQKCIESWRKYLPEYELRLWNEDTFDLDMYPYAREAYDNRKFAFVTDVVRLWALEKFGGVYMDTDVEILRPLGDMMELPAFTGYEASVANSPVTGLMASAAHGIWVKEQLAYYEGKHFVRDDGSLDMTPNTGYFLDWMQKRGFVADGKEKDFMNVHILPVECFCPVLTTGENLRCERTYCEHKGLHSWSGDGGWKEKVLSVFGVQWKTKLIKLKRKIFD